MSHPESVQPHSLQRRLIGKLTLILLVAFVTLWLVTTFAIHELITHYQTTRLQHDAEGVVNALVQTDKGIDIDWTRVDPIYLHPRSGHYFVVTDGHRQLASPSLAGFKLWTPYPPPQNPYETRGGASESEHDRLVLVWMKTVEMGDHPIRVYVAENHLPLQRYVLLFDAAFLFLSILVLLLMLWLTRRSVRQGVAHLAPLRERLQAYAQRGEPFELPPDLPGEVLPLARALQESLHHLEEQLQRYRHANADLAHALKTPLQALFQQLDAPCLAECPEVRTQLKQQLERLHALIERRLKRARLSQAGWEGAAFDLQDDLSSLISVMQRLNPDKCIEVKVSAGHLPLEREDGYELLGNLLDNACKWAHSRISVRVEKAARGIQLCVEDDGPGVAAEQRATLTTRGHRLDERMPGHGLGLTIVGDLVRHYGGEITFSDSDLGGFKVCILLPVPTASL